MKKMSFAFPGIRGETAKISTSLTLDPDYFFSNPNSLNTYNLSFKDSFLSLFPPQYKFITLSLSHEHTLGHQDPNKNE